MKDNHPPSGGSNFWFGFAVGTVSAATVAYLVGTKKGREKLKKLIEMSEHLEERSPDLMDAVQQVVKELQSGTFSEDTATQPAPEKEQPVNASSIENVMDKIKNVSETTKTVKKFFSKSGKITEE